MKNISKKIPVLFALTILVVILFGARGQVSYSQNGGELSSFIRGDANQDTNVNISDAITILTYAFAGGTVTLLDAADVNDSGAIDITDPIKLLNYLFLGGSEPENPFPHAGFDLTTDDPMVGGDAPLFLKEWIEQVLLEEETIAANFPEYKDASSEEILAVGSTIRAMETFIGMDTGTFNSMYTSVSGPHAQQIREAFLGLYQPGVGSSGWGLRLMGPLQTLHSVITESGSALDDALSSVVIAAREDVRQAFVRAVAHASGINQDILESRYPKIAERKISALLDFFMDTAETEFNSIMQTIPDEELRNNLRSLHEELNGNPIGWETVRDLLHEMDAIGFNTEWMLESQGITDLSMKRPLLGTMHQTREEVWDPWEELKDIMESAERNKRRSLEEQEKKSKKLNKLPPGELTEWKSGEKPDCSDCNNEEFSGINEELSVCNYVFVSGLGDAKGGDSFPPENVALLTELEETVMEPGGCCWKRLFVYRLKHEWNVEENAQHLAKSIDEEITGETMAFECLSDIHTKIIGFCAGGLIAASVPKNMNSGTCPPQEGEVKKSVELVLSNVPWEGSSIPMAGSSIGKWLTEKVTSKLTASIGGRDYDPGDLPCQVCRVTFIVNTEDPNGFSKNVKPNFDEGGKFSGEGWKDKKAPTVEVENPDNHNSTPNVVMEAFPSIFQDCACCKADNLKDPAPGEESCSCCE